jgi:3-deoxy-7-phosphoheptulonate synthase
MIIVLKKDSPEEIIESIKETLTANGMSYDILKGVKFTLIPVVGDFTTSDVDRFRALPGVDKIIKISKPYYQVLKDFKEKTVVDIGGGIKIGEGLTFISGPCSVESPESIDKIASFVSGLGIKILRGGTYKLRTSPYSFQGLGKKGLKILRETSDRYGMKCISEIVDSRDLSFFEEYTDIIQVGARNMMNFALLKELSKLKKPILLKRSLSAKIDDFLSSAEYLISGGNENIILCERGVQSFDDMTRSAVNIASIPYLKDLCHLPLIFDPSHSIGIAKYVPPVAEAAAVMGVDGLMIETHYNPANALSDGYQSLAFDSFEKMYRKIMKLHSFLNEKS